MKPELITMLTHNDETVANALEVFDECADLPCSLWGFKDIGLDSEEMRRLVQRMKQAGKSTFLEVVSLTEEECMAGAKVAVEYGFDYLMGTVYFPSVLTFLKDTQIKYFPFCGKIHGHPSVLTGTIEDTIEEARKLENLGVDGFDLLAYRYEGDALGLATEFVKSVRVPVVIAGSIGSLERVEVMKKLKPWAFTIGSAFFEGRFVKNGSFRDQLECVLEQLAGEGSQE